MTNTSLFECGDLVVWECDSFSKNNGVVGFVVEVGAGHGWQSFDLIVAWTNSETKELLFHVFRATNSIGRWVPYRETR